MSANERDGARMSATERDGARWSATERDGARRSATERDGARRNANERDGARSAQRGARGDPTSRPIQTFKHHRSQDRLAYCAAFSNLGVGVSTAWPTRTARFVLALAGAVGASGTPRRRAVFVRLWPHGEIENETRPLLVTPELRKRAPVVCCRRRASAVSLLSSGPHDAHAARLASRELAAS